MAKRLLVISLAVVFVASLGAAVRDLPPAPVRLAPQVAARAVESGASHPVTAVLLDFRGYDTLLEISVLLIALLGLLTVLRADTDPRPPPPAEPEEPVIPALAGLVAPLTVLAAIYLLGAGSSRPGGAFQAGTVLAAGAVLLHLTRRIPAWTSPGGLLRAGLVGGFLFFIAVAAFTSRGGALLDYPAERAGVLLFAVEAFLAGSLGLILAGLFLFPSDKDLP